MKRRLRVCSLKQDRIWELLFSRRGKWIPASELSKISSEYRGNINSIRKRGVVVERKVVDKGGIRRSLYRLKPTLCPTSAADQLGLFSSAELDRCSHRWTDPEET
jgi:hypothetical protein